MSTRFAALLFFLPVVGSANQIVVGNVQISIPSPHGFTPVTSQMAPLHEVLKTFVAPSNEEFISFISDNGVSAAMNGDIPDLGKRFAVQTAKSIVNRSISRTDFDELKKVIRTQNSDVMKRAQERMPGLMEQLNKGLAKQFDMNLAFGVSQMIPMPVHTETDRTLGYSTLVRYNRNDASGKPAPFVVLFTATFVHVKGRVLFLYSYAGENDLDWSRQVSQDWASAVVAANSADFQSSLNESLPSSVTGIKWGEVGAKAIAGAFIGLIVGLFVWIRRRGKAR